MIQAIREEEDGVLWYFGQLLGNASIRNLHAQNFQSVKEKHHETVKHETSQESFQATDLADLFSLIDEALISCLSIHYLGSLYVLVTIQDVYGAF